MRENRCEWGCFTQLPADQQGCFHSCAYAVKRNPNNAQDPTALNLPIELCYNKCVDDLQASIHPTTQKALSPVWSNTAFDTCWACCPAGGGDGNGSACALKSSTPACVRQDPGGTTTCGDGGDYAFFTETGTVNKLLIEFEGGGACWDYATCSLAGIWRRQLTQQCSAIPRVIPNTFDNWSTIFVPYCTGDCNFGDTETTYQAHYHQT